jgi:hypothetical protein
MKRHTSVVAVAAICAATIALAQAPPGPPSDPPPGTTGNRDNVQYLTTERRTDPHGNPVRLARRTGHVSNYSEDKVPPYTLPDPLVMNDGRRVTNADTWRLRREEILAFYREQIYGRVPQTAPAVTWAVSETDPAARGGTAVMKRVVGTIGSAPDAPKMTLTAYVPAGVQEAVPVLVSLTFAAGGRGRAGGAAQQDGPPPFDPIAEVLSHGWAYATLGYTDIQPDTLQGLSAGVIGSSFEPGQTERKAHEWGGISAWAWGLSRAVDYLVTDPAFDRTRISVAGVSRLGKTVLWAAAQDERIAAVFSVVPGAMGAALIRRDWGETLDDMAQNFPWQFAANLQQWVGRWNDLPVDQHMLIALVAPRLLYVNGGLTDQWSDPRGQFLAMLAAGPVYRLLGKSDLGVTEYQIDTPITNGHLAFHYHSSGHTAVPADWRAFLAFASRYFE